MKKLLQTASPILIALLFTACGADTSDTMNTNTVPSMMNTNYNAQENMNSNSLTNANMNNNLNANLNQKVEANSTAIRSVSVAPNSIIASPLTITGQARAWYFEGSFPVQIIDANGKELYNGNIPAVGDWMKDEYVPFKGTITFATPTATTGKIILKKDNPSGIAGFDESYEIPVKF